MVDCWRVVRASRDCSMAESWSCPGRMGDSRSSGRETEDGISRWEATRGSRVIDCEAGGCRQRVEHRAGWVEALRPEGETCSAVRATSEKDRVRLAEGNPKMY